ncbi:hypothetical protein QFZ82_007818 [Streptomyces sp. V4I23]|uniref:hypothetical protein n=1 Tax=Streptomyces sp. V4I23 TaxID=3042282 RepID=UPI002786C060|nr:hypothetical protein [Streptomyces sp. V4I23]MDQ1013333.1 hypothetical protein [Streptomyces sp. V4I23]
MTLLLKLLLAPALVVGSSLAGRRWGSQVTGMLVALPVVASPILLISSIEQGAHFGARAASASLLGLISLALFPIMFAWSSRRYGWVRSLTIAWAVCLAVDLGLAQLTVPPWAGLILALTAARVAARTLSAPTTGTGEDSERLRGGPAWPWWDLPARAVATAVLVLAVTGAAATVGPALTGVLAPSPVATSVVAGFALAQRGSDEAIRLLRGVPVGLLGFSVFCFLVATLVRPVGVGYAFGIAMIATPAVQWAWLTMSARVASHRRQ